MVVEEIDKKTRIHPLFMPIFNSVWKTHPSIMDSLILALRSYCPTASMLELSVMCSILCMMMSKRSAPMAKQIEKEIKDPTCQLQGEKKLESMGIKNSDDVCSVLAEEENMK